MTALIASVAADLSAEADARIDAIQAEADARNEAIQAEAAARIADLAAAAEERIQIKRVAVANHSCYRYSGRPVEH